MSQQTREITAEEYNAMLQAQDTTAKSKFLSKRTEIDGIMFASRREARRYSELKHMERAGEISGLELQPRYPLAVNGEHITTYVADFRYWKPATYGQDLVVEDAKGMKTDVYILKKKLMRAVHNIEIQEV
jgi:hypothetical protein